VPITIRIARPVAAPIRSVIRSRRHDIRRRDVGAVFDGRRRRIGTNKLRLKLFNKIYSHGTKPRSKKQIMAAVKIPRRDAQQVQNALDHLAKHHLIVRIKNFGSVKDGSINLYQKDSSVRANKKDIVKFADNRRIADQTPTKRRPIVSGTPSVRVFTRQTLKKKKRLSVLYLTADPDKANSLRVDAEVRQVQETVRGSAFRDNIILHYKPAADLNSLIDGLNDHRPQVVHFSGHGDGGGIATDNAKIGKHATKFVSYELLAKALSSTDDPPEIIVLNSCKSSSARKNFLPPGKIAIVMRDSVSDLAATAFAAKFYAAIAAGQSVRAAFAQGKVAVEVVSLNEADTPELLCASDVNPAKIILA
jgi:hypothetical protein